MRRGHFAQRFQFETLLRKSTPLLPASSMIRRHSEATEVASLWCSASRPAVELSPRHQHPATRARELYP